MFPSFIFLVQGPPETKVPQNVYLRVLAHFSFFCSILSDSQRLSGQVAAVFLASFFKSGASCARSTSGCPVVQH